MAEPKPGASPETTAAKTQHDLATARDAAASAVSGHLAKQDAALHAGGPPTGGANAAPVSQPGAPQAQPNPPPATPPQTPPPQQGAPQPPPNVPTTPPMTR